MNESVFKKMMRWAADEGWNQSDLASRLGLTPQVISNWKRRENVPPEQYPAIAKLFGCSVDDLLNNEQRNARRTRLWPYPSIDEDKLRAVRDADASKLEGAILFAAAQLGLDVKKDG